MSLDRREAMKVAAMSAACGLASSLASRGIGAPQPPLPEKPEVPDVKWDKAPCRFCGTGCHVQVGVQDGKVNDGFQNNRTWHFNANMTVVGVVLVPALGRARGVRALVAEDVQEFQQCGAHVKGFAKSGPLPLTRS